MKATAKPGSIVTQAVEGVYKLYQLYVRNIQRTSSAVIRGRGCWIRRFVGMLCFERGNVDEVTLHETGRLFMQTNCKERLTIV